MIIRTLTDAEVETINREGNAVVQMGVIHVQE